MCDAYFDQLLAISGVHFELRVGLLNTEYPTCSYLGGFASGARVRHCGKIPACLFLQWQSMCSDTLFCVHLMQALTNPDGEFRVQNVFMKWVDFYPEFQYEIWVISLHNPTGAFFSSLKYKHFKVGE